MNKELLNKKLNDLYDEHKCRLIDYNKRYIRCEVRMKFFSLCKENLDILGDTEFLINEGESLSLNFITKIHRLLFLTRINFNEDTEGCVDLQDFYGTVETDLKNVWRVRKSKSSLKRRFLNILDQNIDCAFNDWELEKRQYNEEYIDWKHKFEEISELIYTNQ